MKYPDINCKNCNHNKSGFCEVHKEKIEAEETKTDCDEFDTDILFTTKAVGKGYYPIG